MLYWYEIINERPIIKIKENNKITEITDYKPYFYIEKSEQTKVPSHLTYEDGYISIFGKELIKIYTQIPSDVRTYRGYFNKHYEADILFVDRFLIDKYKSSPIPNTKLRCCILDIEVGSEKFPDMKNFTSPIICMSFFDSFKDTYYTLIWHNNFTKKIEKKNFFGRNWYILYFKNERNMLYKFCEYLNKIDVITGWNIMNFDMYYIVGRMQTLNLNLNSLSKFGSVKINKNYSEIDIDGIAIFDLMQGYRNLVMKPLSSNSLQYVAEIELGEKKIEIDNFANVWEENPAKVIERNITDVELCRKIDEKYGIIDYWDEIRRICKCQFGEMKSSFLIDNYILGFCKERNIILPSRKKRKKEKIIGAIVFEPKQGLFENVMVFDLKSLYPSIIINFNMSPETLSNKGEIQIPIPELNKIIKFTNQKEGTYPTILQDLIEKRDKMKKERNKYSMNSNEWKSYNFKQTAFKYLTNAFYGVLGYENFRLFNPDIANAVTAIGRECLLWTKKIAINEGFEILYGDTDGIFIKSKQKPLKEGKELEKKLNESYKEFMKKFNTILKGDRFKLQTKFEKVYKKIYFSTKKHYAGRLIWQEGKECDYIDIKGLEFKRRNTSELGRKFQKKVFEILLKEENSLEKIKKIYEFYKKKIMSINENDLEWRHKYLEKICISVPINKAIYSYKTNIPMKRAVIWSNKYLDLKLTRGERVYLVYVKKIENLPQNDVIAFRTADELDRIKFTLDKQKHFEEIVERKVEFLNLSKSKNIKNLLEV